MVYIYIVKTGQRWLADFEARIEDFFIPIINQFPLLQYTVGGNIQNAQNNIEYAYRLLENNMIPEDNEEYFREKRRETSQRRA